MIVPSRLVAAPQLWWYCKALGLPLRVGVGVHCGGTFVVFGASGCAAFRCQKWLVRHASIMLDYGRHQEEMNVCFKRGQVFVCMFVSACVFFMCVCVYVCVCV